MNKSSSNRPTLSKTFIVVHVPELINVETSEYSL